MQAHDYIRSTNQNDTKNSSIFEEREEQTKKRQTIPKFGNVRNRNRRKKKRKRERKIMLIVKKYLISFAATGQV